jgi:aldehyde:ferredoxin oxidoreductase
MPFGYNGKILHVNLTEGEITTEIPPESFYRNYMGGSAFGLYYILREVPVGIDPLSPDNLLTLMVSVTTGTPISGQSRLSANAKSPMTGGIGDSQAGGFFPAELKFAGYDGIVLRGRSPEPVYLSILNGNVSLHPAAHLWGKKTREVDEVLKAEVGDQKAQVMQIGPGAENGVRFSTLVNMANRNNGRTGLGLVMASKNLKAVVVRGNSQVQMADKEAVASLAKAGVEMIPDNLDVYGLGTLGTASVVMPQNILGTLPTRNYTEAQFEHAMALSGETMTDTILKKRDTCYACAVRCKRVVETEYQGHKVDPYYGGPEYETIAAFGPMCGISSLEAISLFHQICNEYGVDTITCGATIAFAMECYEKGLIRKEDTDGLDLSWGNAEAIVSLTKKIGRRDGFGALLADGPRAAADRIGRGAEKWAMHVCGQALPYHDPRTSPAQGTGYFADASPGRHMESSGTQTLENGGALGNDPVLSTPALDRYGDYASKGPMLALGAQFFQVFSSAGFCALLLLGSTVPTAEYVRAVTGWEMDWSEALKAGKRILTLRQAFNAREGILPGDFCLPERLVQPLEVGVSAGQKIDFETMKASYFEAMGWDLRSGKPNPETWVELGLDEL